MRFFLSLILVLFLFSCSNGSKEIEKNILEEEIEETISQNYDKKLESSLKREIKDKFLEIMASKNIPEDLEYLIYRELSSLEKSKKKNFRKSVENINKDLEKSYNASLDSKTLAAYINYFSQSFLLTERSRYRRLATEAFYDLEKYESPEGNYFDNERRKKISISSNAEILNALLMLYRLSSDIRYLEKAIRVADSFPLNLETNSMEDNFKIAKSFLSLYSVTASREWFNKSLTMASYLKDNYDVPNMEGPWIVDYGRYLNLLSSYSGNYNFKNIAKLIMFKLNSEKSGIESLNEKRNLIGSTLLFSMELNSLPMHITTVSFSKDKEAKELFMESLKYPSSFLRTEWYLRSKADLPNPDVLYPEINRSAAFICRQKSCSLPIFSSKDLKKEFELR